MTTLFRGAMRRHTNDRMAIHRFIRLTLLAIAAILAAVFATGSVRADGTDYAIRDELYQHYHALILRYLNETIALESTYRRDLVGKVLDPYRNPRPESDITQTLLGARKVLSEELKTLETAYRTEPDLGPFLKTADSVMNNAIGEIWNVDINLAVLRVEALGATQRGEYMKLYDAYSADKAKLTGLSSAAYEAAVASIDAAYAAKEKVGLERALKDYLAIQEEFLKRRTSRAGDTWQLQDFNLRRARKDSAQDFAFAVYKYFAYHLDQRDRDALRPLVRGDLPDRSVLDWFVTSVGSYDRLIPSTRVAFNAPEGTPYGAPVIGNGVWKMDAALAALPVEALRKYDRRPPALVLNGSKLEQMIQILVVRLTRFYEVQIEQDRIRAQLAAASRGASAVPTLPSAAGLADAFKAALEARQKYEADRAAAAAAQNELYLAAQAQGKARDAYNIARTNLRLSDKGGKVSAVTTGGVTPAELRKKIEGVIANYQNASTEDAKKRLALLIQQRDSIAQVVADALKPLEDALTAATAARDASQKRFDEIAPKDTSAALYSPAKASYDRAVAYLSAISAGITGPALAKLPAELDVKYDYAAAVVALDARIAEVGRQLINKNLNVLGLLAELERGEAELAQLAPAIANARSTGVALAETTMEALGRPADDEFDRSLKRLKDALKSSEEVLTMGKKNLERLETLREFLFDKEGARFLKPLIERLTQVANAWQMSRETVERARGVRRIIGQFERRDPTEMLDALGTLFELGASPAGKVPVLGPLLKDILNFYGQQASAAGEAILKIQAKLVETDLKVHFSRAERHLFTLAEIEPLVRQGSAEKVRDIVQVRRLIFLVHADSLGDVRDIGAGR